MKPFPNESIDSLVVRKFLTWSIIMRYDFEFFPTNFAPGTYVCYYHFDDLKQLNAFK